MRGRYYALSIIALAAGVAGGVFLERLYLNPGDGNASGEAEILYWVAPMDPNFRQSGPGKSPMGMDLIPVYAGQEPSADPAEVSLSAAEVNAIGVRTALARVGEISQQIETVGFVGYDEHLTSHVHTRVDGWIETLNIRAVGDRVKKGEVLFELFSPEFGIASFDFLRSLSNGNGLSVEAARNKLRSHGASEEQIAEIEADRKVARRIKVAAPRDGVVIALAAADGMFLQPGAQAMSITDLNQVWLIVDVFERDIARLTEDMRAVARFEHLPGRTFEGQIDYIYPELDPKTRTLPVRLLFDNTEGLLRPNMFGTVRLFPNETRTAVTIPSEAVIRTGTAERVIIKVDEGTFKPRLITSGLRDNFGENGRTEVVQGLEPGEEVVASAQFLIDSESALNAGLMRMAPTNEAPARGTGDLIALDRVSRIATIRHDSLESLDWPAMTTRFPVAASIPLDRLREGEQVSFKAARGADGLLGLIDLSTSDGIAATGSGTVLAVTSDGKLTMEHGPIPDLGWPAMKMDLDVAGFDPQTVPVNVPVEFDLAKGEGGLFSIVAVRQPGEAEKAADNPATKPAEEVAEDTPAEAAPIVVTGTIDSIDTENAKATITHGPIAEIGMPGMTMAFAVDEDLDLAAIPVGTETTLTFARPDGMTMVLAKAEPVTPPMEVRGTINALDQDAGTANITHGPMAEIGMPGMTMDFAVAPAVAVGDLPLDQEVTLLLQRNPDFSMTLVGVRREEGL
ncbi:putative cation efflux system transmembrane protein [Stappia aggregata IAM 12614]|uniref:Putative cation efflux system transmembrane protein n=1 Tax=Roseibium aggregatum (strain ATCC 25650 / DSM 13394 / JCM 20685 / NBRC 16684 / NCIMB 2208 / IAM 12614 / B1) TaxID=384765 RepID=A0P0D8_ROSAI|nr:efflux RND transporter periplasmic adaptor subunit [Roseibium aggregatum]EAV41546.1 putative cation efflux system transmembrane protein [Stappia aggregata IAM 12614] [Roseibium aggregatum IAM 12614]